MSTSHATIEAKALAEFRASAHATLDSYLSHTNQLIGITGFGMALGCIGLDLPSIYAWISMGFLALAWAVELPKYKRHLAVLKAVRDTRMHWRALVGSGAVALIGWLFLGAVALGVFNKAGVAP